MSTPTSIEALLERAEQLAGRSLKDIAAKQNWTVPANLLRTKGWIGQLIENALGASAASLPMPDFPELGVELKTIPVDHTGKPRESTYVCVVPLTAEPGQLWENSLLWRKLQCILWVPILANPELPIAERIIGTPFLWRPTDEEIRILRNDWEEFMDCINMGQVETITARQGLYLQIRPKAADHHALTSGVNSEGKLMRTLPRGFYLRPQFTQNVLQCCTAQKNT